MTHAKLALGTLAAILAMTACSLGSTSTDSASEDPPGGNSPPGKDRSDGGGSLEQPGEPASSGIVLVHAAKFPSFRLCFENFPDEVPQPDANVMPYANVVGVEIGSAVRIDPRKAPGMVYVIDERQLRLNPNGTSCGVLTKEPPDTSSLRRNLDYQLATAINEPLGENKVTLLAITGCGGEGFLDNLPATSEGCNGSKPWDRKTGSLEAKVVDLTPTREGATDTRLPVQLFHMSPALEAFKGREGSLSVTFGALGGADAGVLEQVVTAGAVFQGGPQANLNVDQTQESFYGAHGFRVNISSATATVTVDQSLAVVQELSAPSDVPTRYYRAASNYALVLLGDPARKPGVDKYEPRQGVHLLAIPVLDPEKADAGAPSSSDGGP